MNNHSCSSAPRWRASILASCLLLSAPVLAVDGVIEINQARVLAGGITPGDTPGFPATLSQAGSYRLTGNLATNSKNVTAIQITASDVSVDLNGFAIACTFFTGTVPAGCLTIGGSGNGVAADHDGFRRLTVKNGVIRNMGGFGVKVGEQGRVEDLHVADNGRNGIFAARGSTITGNTAEGNRRDGIGMSGEGIVTGNTARDNGGRGISMGDNVVVIGNNARNNDGDGFNIGIACTVVNNTASLNGGNGFRIERNSTVIGNTASNNNELGIKMLGAGYKDNVMRENNGGDNNAQVSGGIEIGTNLCGNNTTCP